ncbi:MAG: T9SS type A sorting domain-containing protein [Bacteroidetes bacterium]|nr:T9SS type A sorting domain-containing protein [Bacteroidota bacterium]
MKLAKALLVIILTVLSLTSNAQILKDSLKAFYPFTGSANDISGNNFHGTPNNLIPTEDRFNYMNSAYLFDATDAYINIGDLQLDTAFTISVWIYPTAYNNDGYIIEKLGSSNTDNYLVRLNGDSTLLCTFRSADGSTGYPMFTNIDSLDQWYHIVYSWDGNIAGSKARVYINAEIRDSITAQTPIAHNSTINGFIGWRSSTRRFIGKIDDVRIYNNRSLSSTEVLELYNENICFETIYDTVTVNDTIIINDTVLVSVTDTLIIDVTLDMLPPNDKNTLKIYPNPAKDKIMINTGNFSIMSNYEIKIINTSGQTIFQNLVNQQSFSIDVSQFGSHGLYFVQIIDDTSNIIDVRKIVLE